MKLTPGDVECRLLKSVNSDHIRQAIPLAQFCKLSSQGKIRRGGQSARTADRSR
jgi:hypothetical protein